MHGAVWNDMVCRVFYGWVWYAMVPMHDITWYGMVWYGMVWYGMVWYGMVWYGMVWYGMVWYGMVWYGMVWYGMSTSNFGETCEFCLLHRFIGSENPDTYFKDTERSRIVSFLVILIDTHMKKILCRDWHNFCSTFVRKVEENNIYWWVITFLFHRCMKY